MIFPRLSGGLLLTVLAAGCSGTDRAQADAAAATPPAGSVSFPMAEPSDYLRVCGICHLEAGTGVPGAFPPLDAGLQAIAASEAGRSYLVGILQNGLYGPITVNDVSYNGAMPPLGSQLSAEQMAGLLNYILSAFADTRGAFTASEVDARLTSVGSTTGATLRQRAHQ